MGGKGLLDAPPAVGGRVIVVGMRTRFSGSEAGYRCSATIGRLNGSTRAAGSPSGRPGGPPAEVQWRARLHMDQLLYSRPVSSLSRNKRMVFRDLASDVGQVIDSPEVPQSGAAAYCGLRGVPSTQQCLPPCPSPRGRLVRDVGHLTDSLASSRWSSGL